ncbi:MAG: 3-oxoacyl-[acyl-carrier-protein] synthase III C-terminal domain-containing protein [Micromonosporaceae bacterium]
MDAVHVDCFGHALGERKTSVVESGQAGRLVSAAEDLASAGFAWHHRCDPGTTAYDLARLAVRQLPDRVFTAGLDAILYATCLPGNGTVGDEAAWRSSRDVMHLMDYPASRLQADLGQPRAAVIGVTQQGCTGMLGAVRLAHALLVAEPEWQRVLCVTADRFPEGARYEHSYNLISDSAAACVVAREPGRFRFVAAEQITNGGLHAATDDETIGTYFSYTRELVRQVLARAGLSASDLDWVVPQNTNRRAWQILSRLIGIDAATVWQPTLPDNGHAISADTIVNLAELADSGRVRPGQRVLLVVAGYGLNWQAVLLEATEECR